MKNLSLSSRLRPWCLLLLWLPFCACATTVRLSTTLGNIDIVLYDTAAPRTVANFLDYVRNGAYDSSFIHRSMPGFVIQGGGYSFSSTTNSYSKVVSATPVANEFDQSRSNVRGTVAMAKLGGDPDSATSEWFVNLADNAANLDNQNGGFTVFGMVTEAGMAVVDKIALLTVANAGGAFTNIPLVSVPANGSIQEENLVLVTRAAILPSTADLDRIFNYLEVQYDGFLAPAQAVSQAEAGYYYRYYPTTQAYVGVEGETLYYLGPASDNTLLNMGAIATWLDKAIQAGY